MLDWMTPWEMVTVGVSAAAMATIFVATWVIAFEGEKMKEWRSFSHPKKYLPETGSRLPGERLKEPLPKLSLFLSGHSRLSSIKSFSHVGARKH